MTIEIKMYVILTMSNGVLRKRSKIWTIYCENRPYYFCNLVLFFLIFFFPFFFWSLFTFLWLIQTGYCPFLSVLPKDLVVLRLTPSSNSTSIAVEDGASFSFETDADGTS